MYINSYVFEKVFMVNEDKDNRRADIARQSNPHDKNVKQL